MTRNFYQRFFNFIGHYNRIMKKYAVFDTHDNHDVYLDSLYIGREMGEAVRTLYSYDPYLQ